MIFLFILVAIPLMGIAGFKALMAASPPPGGTSYHEAPIPEAEQFYTAPARAIDPRNTYQFDPATTLAANGSPRNGRIGGF